MPGSSGRGSQMGRGSVRSGSAGRPVSQAKKVLIPFQAEATSVVFPEGTSESSKLKVAR